MKLTKGKTVTGIIFLILFLLVQFMFINKFEGTMSYVMQILGFLFLGISLSAFIPQKALVKPDVSKKLSKRTMLAMLMVLVAIPITVFVGYHYLNDRKYYFISLLIIIEIMLPFAISFEGKKLQARELVTISVLCALAVAGRCAFFMIPQFKPLLAIVIISGICFGGETGFLIGAVSGFVSNFYYGQGALTPWQMFAFGIIGFLAGILYSKGILKCSKVSLCIFGGISTLVIYGGIMNPASVIVWDSNFTKNLILSSFVMGFPFDLIHAVSTVFFLWVFSQPLIEKIERVKTKYGILKTEA